MRKICNKCGNEVEAKTSSRGLRIYYCPCCQKDRLRSEIQRIPADLREGKVELLRRMMESHSVPADGLPPGIMQTAAGSLLEEGLIRSDGKGRYILNAED